MSLQNRVEKLEQRAGEGAGEECKHGFDVRYYDNNDEGYFINDAPAEADETPPKVCDVCGLKQTRIAIVYVKGRDEHEAAGVPLP
jgi:hypothetical protein